MLFTRVGVFTIFVADQDGFAVTHKTSPDYCLLHINRQLGEVLQTNTETDFAPGDRQRREGLRPPAA